MMAQQYGYGYDQMAMMQQLESQPYTAAGTDMGMGTDMYGQPVQSMPMQTATLAGGQQPGELGLPASGVTEQPQLPPPQLEESEIPPSPFADAETQTLEEEIGAETEVAEMPIEPDTSAPEPEGESPVPEPQQPEAQVQPQVQMQPQPQPPTPTVAGPTVAEGGAGKKCQNCGASVKEGWFLCPECKQPLI